MAGLQALVLPHPNMLNVLSDGSDDLPLPLVAATDRSRSRAYGDDALPLDDRAVLVGDSFDLTMELSRIIGEQNMDAAVEQIVERAREHECSHDKKEMTTDEKFEAYSTLLLD